MKLLQDIKGDKAENEDTNIDVEYPLIEEYYSILYFFFGMCILRQQI
jgi:hypothetical protein